MPAAPLPPDETERLALLHALALLDTPPEAVFDRVTRLVGRLLDVPMAMFSLVDAERQWFKSRVGVEAAQTPREYAFCAHALAQSAPLIVADASVDARFADNPLVTSAPISASMPGCRSAPAPGWRSAPCARSTPGRACSTRTSGRCWPTWPRSSSRKSIPANASR